MIVVTETKEVWVDPDTVRELFSSKDLGLKPITSPMVEVDSDLGLEIVKKQTLEEFYDLPPQPPKGKSSFVDSLREQFEQRGRLSEKQVACLRKPKF